jgi:cytochrome c-type biogenesis protein
VTGNEITSGVAFTAGLLSFFTPCVLPLVPAYIANLAGITAIDIKNRTSFLPTLFHSLAFVLGFSAIFIALGASVGLIGTFLTAQALVFRWISGSVIILFGIFVIASHRIPWLNYQKRLNLNTSSSPGYIRSFLIGAVFALGWTPCVGPILGAILLMSWGQDVARGAYLLSIYCLGLGIPFIIIGMAWGKIMPFWKSITKHLGKISIISGIFLIIVGILILTGTLSRLSQVFSI